jgi:hypothetical protein
MKSIAWIFWAALVMCSTPAQAESLRCNGDLAGVRDTKVSMLMKCGQPFFTDWFCKPTDPDLPYVPPCQLVEEWYYNPGSGQFITIMRFERGVVTSIRYGDRVR